MKPFHNLVQSKLLFLFVFLLLSAIWLTGCKQEGEADAQPGSSEDHKTEEEEEESVPPSDKNEEPIVPIEIQDGNFYAVNGWLNDETIVYVTNKGTGSNLFSYNLYTGENSLIFESSAPIGAVHISPSGKRLLVHSSPTTYEAILTILEKNGEEVMTQSLAAFDLVIDWNPYNENMIFVSSFTENWDFTSYQLNIMEKKLNKVQIKEPFAQWQEEDQLLYLDWSIQSPSLFAPLVNKSVSSLDEISLLEDVYQFKAIKDHLMTITVPSDKMEQATYTFWNNALEELTTFSVPHLTKFSDWLVPYFDFQADGRFFTFQPLYSTEADTYAGGFQLISFDLNKEEKAVVIEGLENEPINCSPNGKRCLYGFYFEKLVNLENREIVQLVKE